MRYAFPFRSLATRLLCCTLFFHFFWSGDSSSVVSFSFSPATTKSKLCGNKTISNEFFFSQTKRFRFLLSFLRWKRKKVNAKIIQTMQSRNSLPISTRCYAQVLNKHARPYFVVMSPERNFWFFDFFSPSKLKTLISKRKKIELNWNARCTYSFSIIAYISSQRSAYFRLRRIYSNMNLLLIGRTNRHMPCLLSVRFNY